MLDEDNRLAPSLPFAGVGNRLRAAREVFGLTQAQFGAPLGFSVSHVSNWESGRYRPSLDNCVALRETYGFSIDFIVLGNLDALPHSLAR